MTKMQDSWKELGDQLQALGLKLQLHVEAERSVDDDDVRATFTKVGAAIENVFDALGDAFDDEAVRSDAKQAGRLLLEAVDATFTEVTDELRDRLRGR